MQIAQVDIFSFAADVPRDRVEPFCRPTVAPGASPDQTGISATDGAGARLSADVAPDAESSSQGPVFGHAGYAPVTGSWHWIFTVYGGSVNTHAVHGDSSARHGLGHLRGRDPRSESTGSARGATDVHTDPMVPDLGTLRLVSLTADVTELIEQHVGLVGALVAERFRTIPTHVDRDDLTPPACLLSC